MKNYNKIIFVGQSGTSRAAMAKGILLDFVLRKTMQVEARGMVVLFAEPINPKAEAVLISNGITLEGFKSQPLTETDISEDALILCMERAHKERILATYENASVENVHVLTEYVGDELEIMDPYGGALQSYGLCYETLRKSIKKLANKLNEGEA